MKKMKNELKEILLDFIQWIMENSDDVFYIYENPDEAVKRYLEKDKNEKS